MYSVLNVQCTHYTDMHCMYTVQCTVYSFRKLWNDILYNMEFNRLHALNTDLSKLCNLYCIGYRKGVYFVRSARQNSVQVQTS